MTALRRLAIGFSTDWSHTRAYSFAGRESAGSGPYYVHWDGGNGPYGEEWSDAPRDAQGVLLTKPHRTYHAVRIAQYALQKHSVWYATGNESAKEEFLSQARWLRDSQREREGVAGLYVFDFPWPKYGASSGWCSAMAQGEAISVLLRAQVLAPGAAFGDAALRAAFPFSRTIQEGGVVWRERGGVFLEEIANAPAAHVLNGCIFALWGVWELYQRTGDVWLRRIVDQVLDTMESWLPKYDTGWWSLYSLLLSARDRPHIATLKYHAFHIAQLRVLAQMFDRPAFAMSAKRWADYVDDPASRVRLLLAQAGSLYDRALRLDTVRGGAHT